VVEGLSGQAAAQRSVVSDHRSEDAAREDARNERNRLEVIYGEAASDWRVVVIRDDEVVWEERPKGSSGPRLAPSTPDPTRFPDERDPATRRAAPAGAAPPKGVDRDPAPGDPSPEPEPAPEPEPEAEPEPETSGPVPAWLIERVEQSIARSQQRDRERDQGG
jgi:hypothetical protein